MVRRAERPREIEDLDEVEVADEKPILSLRRARSGLATFLVLLLHLHLA